MTDEICFIFKYAKLSTLNNTKFFNMIDHVNLIKIFVNQD